MDKIDKCQNLPSVISDDGTVTVTQELGIIPSFWGVDGNTITAVKQAISISNTKHGLLSAVPIICRGSKCPFLETCYIDDALRHDLAVKIGRCAIEIAAILQRFEKYCHFFSVTDDDLVDMGLIKDMVDIEVQILRCDNKLAISGDFIEEVVAGMSAHGKTFHRPEIHLAAVQKEKLRKERYVIYKLLDSTRHDRAKTQSNKHDMSKAAAGLIARVLELQEKGLLRPVHEMMLGKDQCQVIDTEFVESDPNTGLNPEEINTTPSAFVGVVNNLENNPGDSIEEDELEETFGELEGEE